MHSVQFLDIATPSAILHPVHLAAVFGARRMGMDVNAYDRDVRSNVRQQWPDTTRSRQWMHRVITLLEAALGQLHSKVHPAQGALLEAASLLRKQIDPEVAEAARDRRGGLLAWK